MLIIGSPPIMWGADDPERHHFRCLGSPPLAWGVAVRYGPQHVHPRFTPTRVGIWRDTDRRRISSAVHPHSRGDLRRSAGSAWACLGSPPLAWGFVVATDEPRPPGRFTPTRVGICVRRRSPTSPSPVHPHSRGDLDKRFRISSMKCGSPPLAWGFVGGIGGEQGADRFTPTRVGICAASARGFRRVAVHPHSRGDLCRDDLIDISRGGSPPLAWGFVRAPSRRRVRQRFTPTRVGICPNESSAPEATSVHPHSRGDLAIRPAWYASRPGSPPLAWGFDVRERIDEFDLPRI